MVSFVRFNLLLIVCGVGALCAQEDPAAMGPHTVIETGYDFGPTAWSDPVSRERCDFSARVYHPRNIQAGPYPIVFVLHGRHPATYTPDDDGKSNTWPPKPGYRPIPNSAGYDWIARPLASRGCIVVSIAANALPSFDNYYDDIGNGIRQRIVYDHITLWRRLASETVAPFGDSFVGAVDFQRVGLIGHSRGGETMASLARQLTTEAQVDVEAVALLAPTNTPQRTLADVPTAIIMGQLDGDVRNLEGVHYFDDDRWQAESERYLAIFDGGNHNFFNRFWDPDEFVAGAKDDNTFGSDASFAITGGTQRSASASYLSAFFRQHLLGDAQWQSLLNGDQDLPAPWSDVALRRSWHPGLANSLAINSSLTIEHASRNDLAGSTLASGSLTAATIGGGYPLPDHVLSDEDSKHTFREVHWDGSSLYFFADTPGLRQHLLTWTGTDGVWRNHIPVGSQDWTAFDTVQLRLALNHEHSSNAVDQAQDLSIRLVDGSGASAVQSLSGHGEQAPWPVGAELDAFSADFSKRYMPRLILSQVGVPLDAFTGIDLTDIHSIDLLTDRTASGQVICTDLMLVAQANHPPQAGSIAASTVTPGVGAVTTLSVDVSDPDTDPVTVSWDLGDGTTLVGNPVEHQWSAAGTVVVTAQVSDGQAQVQSQRAIMVQPAASNSLPLITAIDDIMFDDVGMDTTVHFTVTDSDGPQPLRLWATSSDTDLIAPQGLLFGGSGENRSLSLRPFTQRTGTAIITIFAWDGLATSSQDFILNVQRQGGATGIVPVVTWRQSLVRVQDANSYNTDAVHNERWFLADSMQTLSLSIDDADSLFFDGSWQNLLTTEVQSSDPAVLPASAVELSHVNFSTQFNVALDLTDATAGDVTLTLLFHDQSGNTGQCDLLVHVLPADHANTAPSIDTLTANPATLVRGAGIALDGIVIDADGPAPLFYQWFLAFPHPPGFDVGQPNWWLGLNNDNDPDGYFDIDRPFLMHDGTYRFELAVHDGLATTIDTVEVSVDKDQEDLLALWPCDEESGRRYDQWQYAYHLDPLGTIGSVPGRIGRAASFDGASLLAAQDRVNEGLALNDSLTIVLWCRPDTLAGTQSLMAKHSATQPGWALSLIDGRPQFLVQDASGAQLSVTADAPILQDAWSHITATLDASAGRLELWIGDDMVDSLVTSIALATAIPALTVGGLQESDAITQGFRGAIDSAAIWRAVLPADRIAAYASAGSGNRRPLVSWQQPIHRQAYASNEPVDLAFAVVDPDGDPVTLRIFRSTITDGVDYEDPFTAQSAPLATITEAPYTFQWNAPDGHHAIFAIADDGIQLNASREQRISVGMPLDILIDTGPNENPIITTATGTTPITGTIGQLTASATDPDGDMPLSFQWVCTDKPASATQPGFSPSALTANPTVTYFQAGTYRFMVTVQDGRGGTATSPVSVEVVQTPSGMQINH